MAVTKITGDAEIDSIIASLHKNFGRDNLVALGVQREALKSVSTGSLGLDIGIGIGGLPLGRIIEIFGPESSGKTSLALFMAAQYDERKAELGHDKRFILIIDLEHTITLQLLEGIGLDSGNVIFVKPNTAEEGFQSMMDLTKSGKIGFMILDSIDAAQSEAQLKKAIGENEMGGISKIMSRTLREYSKVCSETETIAVFINQIRENPGKMFGSPQVTPGGNALKFYSTLRFETMQNQRSENTPNAFTMRVKFKKNKVFPPREEPVAFDFIYAQGIDPIMDTINTAKELGIVRSAGSSVKVKWPDAEEGTLASGGVAGAKVYLEAYPEVLERLRKVCMEKAYSTYQLNTTGVTIENDPATESTDGTLTEQAQ